ncbi:MAG: molybdopterin oxidoreductase family protein [Myxococcales bacterium FL481]|nr:MAG: molybdopterin oxidoreductase family protein [Myxococcales bacterium FL481]
MTTAARGKAHRYEDQPDVAVVRGVCPHDCPDACAWQVAVDQTTGRAVDLWGAPDHPVTAGSLCAKVDRYLERTYHAERLTTPLRRMGAKGEGRFAPISWQEAIEETASRLQAIISQHGAEAVLPYSYGGTLGYLQGEGMAERFFTKMGASRLARTICAEAGVQGYQYTVGGRIGTDSTDFAHAKLIWIWGSNSLTSNLHLWRQIQTARHQGAKVVVIDPIRTRTARAADEWVPITPGTDGALALAVMHVLVRDNLIDHDYVREHTIGFEPLTDRARDWSPERVATITGIPSERIVELARDYGRTKPAAIRINYGLQRHPGGGMATRTIACLPALVGAWRHRGGGILLTASGAFDFDTRPLTRPELATAPRLPRRINMNRLGDALSRDPARLAQAHHHPRPRDRGPSPAQAGPPVFALVVYNCNPAAVAPDQRAVLEGLRRDDLFVAVLEHFATDTADYADIVFPATTQLEHWDLVPSYGHLHLALNRPAIAPVGESQPNSEIFRRLAAAMGYADAAFRQDDRTIVEALVTAQQGRRLPADAWAHLLQHGHVRLAVPDPYLPFAKGEFPTESGKCELYSATMARDGYDPLPTYTPAAVEPDELVLLSPPAHSFLNSSFVNVDALRRREPEPAVTLHPDDAQRRGLDETSTARVHNATGELRLPVRLSRDIAPGIAVAPSIWWNKLSPQGANVNQLTPAEEADMGGGAVFFHVPVRVERAP